MFSANIFLSHGIYVLHWPWASIGRDGSPGRSEFAASRIWHILYPELIYSAIYSYTALKANADP